MTSEINELRNSALWHVTNQIWVVCFWLLEAIKHAREPASFWRENVIAVVILQMVLARMSCREKVIKYRKCYLFMSIVFFLFRWRSLLKRAFNIPRHYSSFCLPGQRIPVTFRCFPGSQLVMQTCQSCPVYFYVCELHQCQRMWLPWWWKWQTIYCLGIGRKVIWWSVVPC